MRFRPPQTQVMCRTGHNFSGNPESDDPGPAGRAQFGRLALVAVNQILPYGRVIRSRMKPAADELTGVLSWTCRRTGVF
jgi:hypothetical protein